MERNDAIAMIQAYYKANEVESPGLNEKNLGGASVGPYQIYFEYLPKDGILRCSALIYSFREDPKPGILEGFQEAEKAGANVNGGYLEFQPENRGLYLSRDYTTLVSAEEFAANLTSLMQATEEWGGPILEQVAAKAFKHQ
jgi:hypothetical protein